MPITRKQFELGVDATITQMMRVIYDFLRRNSEVAFSTEELDRELFGGKYSQAVGPTVLSAALFKLVETGVVEERRVRGASYYAYVVGSPLLDL